MKGKKTPTQPTQNQPARKKKTSSRRKPENPGPSPGANSGDDEATKRFLADLAIRGEAIEIPKGGKLPSQATHVITKTNPDGTIEVKRKRFKLV